MELNQTNRQIENKVSIKVHTYYIKADPVEKLFVLHEIIVIR